MYNCNFPMSDAMQEKALKVIPNGTGTFSKSRTALIKNKTPFFAEYGKGCWLFDADGNKYVDYTMGLTAVLLGYRFPQVDRAVIAQIEACGAIFSLPHRLEAEVAEQIIDMVPCAEMVRFGKNGSDATAGAVRLARYVTGRDVVLCCGYHGWQDWYIGTTGRNGGVPGAVAELTKQFAYNDIESFNALMDEYAGRVACVIMEPMNREYPVADFLESIQKRCKAEGAIFILDEVITGFRFAKGGAQQILKIKPDLCTLGKGIANGYPLSAVAGRRDLMEEFSKVHFSFTYSGDCIGLAAAKATLSFLADPFTNVHREIRSEGNQVLKVLGKELKDETLSRLVQVYKGHPSWVHLNFTNPTVKAFFIGRMAFYGVLTLGTFNIAYAHNDTKVGAVMQEAIRRTFSDLLIVEKKGLWDEAAKEYGTVAEGVR